MKKIILLTEFCKTKIVLLQIVNFHDLLYLKPFLAACGADMEPKPNFPDANTIKQRDLEHHWHPFMDTKDLGMDDLRLITQANGSHIWDSNGQRILDGMAGLWCVNVGYGRDEIAKAAFEQMQELPYYNTFFKSTHAPAAELAEKIASITPGDLNRIFFNTSGSDSNDTVFL